MRVRPLNLNQAAELPKLWPGVAGIIMASHGTVAQELLAATIGEVLLSGGTASEGLALWNDAVIDSAATNAEHFNALDHPLGFSRLQDIVNDALLQAEVIERGVHLGHAGWDYGAFLPVEAYAHEADARPINLVERPYERRETRLSIAIHYDRASGAFAPRDLLNAIETASQRAFEYAGLDIIIVGHADPVPWLSAERDGASDAEMMEIRQALDERAMDQARSVAIDFREWLDRHNVSIPQSHISVETAGMKEPLEPILATEEAAGRNTRVEILFVPRSGRLAVR